MGEIISLDSASAEVTITKLDTWWLQTWTQSLHTHSNLTVMLTIF